MYKRTFGRSTLQEGRVKQQLLKCMKITRNRYFYIRFYILLCMGLYKVSVFSGVEVTTFVKGHFFKFCHEAYQLLEKRSLFSPKDGFATFVPRGSSITPSIQCFLFYGRPLEDVSPNKTFLCNALYSKMSCDIQRS